MQQQYNHPSTTQSYPTHKLEVYYNGVPCLQGLSINTGPHAHAVRDRDRRPNHFRDAYDPMREARQMPTDHPSMSDPIYSNQSGLMAYPLDRSIAGPFLRSYMALPHFASQY